MSPEYQQNWQECYIMKKYTRYAVLPEASFVVCVFVCPSARQSQACPRDNPPPIQARITKFGSKV